ncbi:hypothetical protein ABW20_dc0110334 [Dactylellina cionopaga]|nr:hypothetical protein ABW20_dc0110334 [Dactylellina cionopaga]
MARIIKFCIRGNRFEIYDLDTWANLEQEGIDGVFASEIAELENRPPSKLELPWEIILGNYTENSSWSEILRMHVGRDATDIKTSDSLKFLADGSKMAEFGLKFYRSYQWQRMLNKQLKAFQTEGTISSGGVAQYIPDKHSMNLLVQGASSNNMKTSQLQWRSYIAVNNALKEVTKLQRKILEMVDYFGTLSINVEELVKRCEEGPLATNNEGYINESGRESYDYCAYHYADHATASSYSYDYNFGGDEVQNSE